MQRVVLRIRRRSRSDARGTIAARSSSRNLLRCTPNLMNSSSASAPPYGAHSMAKTTSARSERLMDCTLARRSQACRDRRNHRSSGEAAGSSTARRMRAAVARLLVCLGRARQGMPTSAAGEVEVAGDILGGGTGFWSMDSSSLWRTDRFLDSSRLRMDSEPAIRRGGVPVGARAQIMGTQNRQVPTEVLSHRVPCDPRIWGSSRADICAGPSPVIRDAPSVVAERRCLDGRSCGIADHSAWRAPARWAGGSTSCARTLQRQLPDVVRADCLPRHAGARR